MRYGRRVNITDLQTPALVVDADAFDHNLAVMAGARPGLALRPHVKAHKCTALARRQVQAGHSGFTCATIAEAEGMALAGMGADLLVANEVANARRLGALTEAGHSVILAVDSDATIDAAAEGGVTQVLVDVNVGLPRCGCDPADAGRLADRARSKGLDVRGVMGYEGHVVGVEDRDRRVAELAPCMEKLVQAHDLAGGDIISAGGTGTYDINTWASEIQAGSYALMDNAYDKLNLPFRQALSIVATIISVSPEWMVADCGLKAMGMDHGNPTVEGGTVWFCSDEHLTFSPDPQAGDSSLKVGSRVRVFPGHVDPTVAYHERMHLVRDGEVIEVWPVDLRGW